MTDTHSRPLFLSEIRSELARVAHEESLRLHRTRRPRRIRTVALASVLALAVAGGAGAATGVVSFPDLLHPGSGPPPQDGPRLAAADSVGEFDPALVRELEVLRRPRTADDAMGATASRHVASNVAPAASLRITAPDPPAGTPHATTAALPTWIVPTSTGTAALYSLAPGATGPGTGVAADVAMLLAGRAYMTTDDELIGLAPNGVRMVTVSLADGSTVELSVVGNVFGAQFDQPVTSVELGGRR